MSFPHEIPELLIFAHRRGPMFPWQQAAIARTVNTSYNLVYAFEPGLTAHQAANVALKRSTSRFVAIMDDDCIPLTNNWLGRLVNILKRNDDLAAVTPMEVKSMKEVSIIRKTPEVAGAHLPWTLMEMTWTATYLTLIDREKVPGILLDENMPGTVGMADVDLCLTIRSSGYKVGMTNEAVVYHPDKNTDPAWREKWKVTPINKIPAIFKKQQEFMLQKWGKFYADNFQINAIATMENK